MLHEHICFMKYLFLKIRLIKLNNGVDMCESRHIYCVCWVVFVCFFGFVYLSSVSEAPAENERRGEDICSLLQEIGQLGQ